jgi:hypothetical protein
MENVRSAIQEHCNAIQQILREENEHWNEIHIAIDQYVLMLHKNFFVTFYLFLEI